MNGTDVKNSGEAGVWLVNAITADFDNNTIQTNALTSTLRSGIEINAGGELDAYSSSFNKIINNTFHEVSTTSSGQTDLGRLIGGEPGGKNDIYDTGTQATGERYISEGGTYSVSAEDNCWNTTSAPGASFFSGTVDRTPFWSCTRSFKNGAVASSKSLRQLIQDARQKVLDSAPHFQAGDISALHSLQRLDRSNSLREKALTMLLMRNVVNSTPSLNVQSDFAARERAMLVEIQDALANEKYTDLTQRITSYEAVIQTPSNVIELLFSKVSLYEYMGSYDDAMRTLASIESHRGYASVLAPTLAIMRDAIQQRISEDGGINTNSKENLLAELANNVIQHVTAPNAKRSSLERKNEALEDDSFSVYPNPFNPSTTVRFVLKEEAPVKMEVFNVLGELVKTMADSAFPSGLHQIRFDASDQPSGLYLLRTRIGANVRSSQIVLLK